MSSLPLLDKNAILASYVSRSGINTVLDYSHYDIGRHYSLFDSTRVDFSKISSAKQKDFWEEYFSKLEKKLGWDFVKREASGPLGNQKAVSFQDEGQGVAAVRMVFSAYLNERNQSIAALHSHFPDFRLSVLDNKSSVDIFKKILEKLGYDEMLFLDLNIDRFDIYRVQKSKTLNRKEEHDGWSSKHQKISWDSPEGIIDSIRDSRLRAFLSVNPDDQGVYNSWANFILQPASLLENRSVQDVLRSFVSVQLMSIYNNDIGLLKDFASKGGSRSLVVVCGDILNLLTDNQLMLSIFDSLQLRGSFDMVFDQQYKWYSLGKSFSEGVNTQEYIVTANAFKPYVSKVLIPEIPGKAGERKTIFMGDLTSGAKENRDIFTLTPELTLFNLPMKESASFEGKFVKGAYIEGHGEDFLFASNSSEGFVDKVIVDGRFKPVVYGPDYRSNLNKIKSWINE